MIGRPKIKNKKQNISLTINKELMTIFNKFVEEKKITRSEFLDYLLNKEIIKKI
jgi:metal-responsive CopG/Arc/MetJ family transcriptional regulator